MTSAGQPELVGRNEADDDYDLLTYGEVAARLSEELAAVSERIAELEGSADRSELQALRDRLALLTATKHRYEQQAQTADVFMKRFGVTPRRPGVTENQDSS